MPVTVDYEIIFEYWKGRSENEMSMLLNDLNHKSEGECSSYHTFKMLGTFPLRLINEHCKEYQSKEVGE